MFITYVLHSLTHHFSGIESWVCQHKTVLEQAAGWQIGEKDVTDDRLGRLAEVLGENDQTSYKFQTRMGQPIISNYRLPTEIARYDTTSFNVHHHPENAKNGILQFGHSKNYRRISHRWQERWIVTCSHTHAQRQKKLFDNRLDQAESKLTKIKPKEEDTVESFRIRAKKILQAHGVQDYFHLEVNESITTPKKYLRRGRPGPKTPFEMVDMRSLKVVAHRDEKRIDQFRQLAGWRIYVTNVSESRMTLNQSSQYYRDEWLVERGFHRFKKG